MTITTEIRKSWELIEVISFQTQYNVMNQNLDAQKATFTLTNISPQFSGFNQNAWNVFGEFSIYRNKFILNRFY